ncbi:P-loop containing nucleoside triphosphate hydrolase protein [Hesseltinella vesiculosa]|uniref:P-loop containing nucleoside triphosphate hydrolase protein n=1 Tax=Hesseltinella vesiculosa TaxID=101127 RepID=A0A1X2G7L1_9FUNG|nr:P-loop containing nucleoside triphosphate hydrolase protein [Hesseltinella vesiculosa]
MLRFQLQQATHEPPIRVSTADKTATVATLAAFLDHSAKAYLLHVAAEQAKRARARYEYSGTQAKWVQVCSLHDNLGLATVALCPKNERLVKQDLDAFVDNRDFYKRVGLAYQRGYLLYGSPGTGKTSLVLAIASYLGRSLYFINLGYIRSDAELLDAFVSIPTNAVVVFEDVDAQTTVLHRRSQRVMTNTSDQDDDGEGFNLSTFLSILDGHTMADGILFIMTTNHKLKLDPAVIRSGRMDVHMELTLATHYQMRQMFRMARMDLDDPTKLDDIDPTLADTIPEFVIPPSEVMKTMILCRDHRQDIPLQLSKLAHQCQPQTIV